MITKYLYSTLLLLGIMSCAKPTAELSAAEKVAISGEVRETLNKYYAEVNRNGLTAEFNYLDNSPDFYWTPPGYTAPITYKEVEKGVQQNAKVFASIDNKWRTLNVYPLTSHLASYTGLIESSVSDTAGTPGVYTLLETGIVIKRANGWKLLSGQTSVIKEGIN